MWHDVFTCQRCFWEFSPSLPQRYPLWLRDPKGLAESHEHLQYSYMSMKAQENPKKQWNNNRFDCRYSARSIQPYGALASARRQLVWSSDTISFRVGSHSHINMSIISGYPHSLQLAFACYHLSSLFLTVSSYRSVPAFLMTILGGKPGKTTGNHVRLPSPQHSLDWLKGKSKKCGVFL